MREKNSTKSIQFPHSIKISSDSVCASGPFIMSGTAIEETNRHYDVEKVVNSSHFITKAISRYGSGRHS